MKYKLFFYTLLLTAITLIGCTQKNNATNDIAAITVDDAKRIALEKVSGATNEHIVEFRPETDDNRAVYDGKIHFEGKEYDFEIDMTTGEIIEWDVENI